ncbi:MAG: hypothetical protein R3362_09360 [Rhodothermales bacterium]|nr:hypothetical protein [Rhodothermales bacterium]
MYRLLLLLTVVLLVAAPAAAQELTITRDGDTVVITRPDGTTERIAIEEGTPLRVRVETGEVIVERRGEEVRLDRDGGPLRPRSFAFRFDDEDVPFGDFEFDGDFGFDFDGAFRVGPDSLLHRLPHHLDGLRERLEFALPFPPFAGRGVSPELRERIAEAERESRALARRLRSADGGAERDRLQQELRETLEEAFRLRQEARAERIEALRDRAESLREDAAELREEVEELEAERREREAQRREIIERRERELLGEDDGLDW